jgi:hypothetical protein
MKSNYSTLTVVAVFSDGKSQIVQTRFNLKIFH